MIYSRAFVIRIWNVPEWFVEHLTNYSLVKQADPGQLTPRGREENGASGWLGWDPSWATLTPGKLLTFSKPLCNVGVTTAWKRWVQSGKRGLGHSSPESQGWRWLRREPRLWAPRSLCVSPEATWASVRSLLFQYFAVLGEEDILSFWAVRTAWYQHKKSLQNEIFSLKV